MNEQWYETRSYPLFFLFFCFFACCFVVVVVVVVVEGRVTGDYTEPMYSLMHFYSFPIALLPHVVVFD